MSTFTCAQFYHPFPAMRNGQKWKSKWVGEKIGGKTIWKLAIRSLALMFLVARVQLLWRRKATKTKTSTSLLTKKKTSSTACRPIPSPQVLKTYQPSLSGRFYSAYLEQLFLFFFENCSFLYSFQFISMTPPTTF